MYQVLSVLGKIIKASWGKIFQGESSTEAVNLLCEKVKSTKEGETYTFSQLFTKVREWIDKAVFDTGETYEFYVKNRKWMSGFDVDVDTTEDIKSSSPLSADLQGKFSGVVDDFTTHHEQLLNDLFVANGNAFDKTAFFATARPNITNGTNLNNLLTGTGATLATITVDLSSAKKAIDAMKINGKALNRGAKVTVYCPTQLAPIFEELKNSENVIIGGVTTTNIHRGSFEIVKNYDQSTSDNDWYLVNSAAKMKPIILQERQAPTMKEVLVEDEDIYKYIWKARYNEGYGNPFSIVKVNN